MDLRVQFKECEGCGCFWYRARIIEVWIDVMPD
jgi:hypothetical protein